MLRELFKLLLAALLSLSLALSFACSQATGDDDDDSEPAADDDDDTSASPCEGVEPELIELSPAELRGLCRPASVIPKARSRFPLPSRVRLTGQSKSRSAMSWRSTGEGCWSASGR